MKNLSCLSTQNNVFRTLSKKSTRSKESKDNCIIEKKYTSSSVKNIPNEAVYEAIVYLVTLWCEGLATGKLQLYQIPFSVWVFLVSQDDQRYTDLLYRLTDTYDVLSQHMSKSNFQLNHLHH
jgi:hypothetical protein